MPRLAVCQPQASAVLGCQAEETQLDMSECKVEAGGGESAEGNGETSLQNHVACHV